MLEPIDGVLKKEGALPGKTVAVFGGVHGNEGAGIHAVRNAHKTLEIKRGVVYFVEANPLAIQNNVRAINKNLNVAFSARLLKMNGHVSS